MKNYTDEFSFVLKPSSIVGAGVGIFATHGIKAGTKLTLMPDGGESRTLRLDDVPEALRHFCISLPDGKVKAPKAFNHLWIVWYINHSDNPNAALNTEEIIYYAIKDIKVDEEILTDYNAFDEPEEEKQEYYKK